MYLINNLKKIHLIKIIMNKSIRKKIDMYIREKKEN